MRTADAISLKVRSSSRRRVSETSMEISYSPAPHRILSLTSGRAINSSCISSPNFFLSRCVISPNTETPRAQISFLARITSGLSMSFGKFVIPSTRFSIRDMISLMSSLVSISKAIFARSRKAFDWIVFMPCKPSRAASIGRTTPFSTSTGAAPG